MNYGAPHHAILVSFLSLPPAVFKVALRIVCWVPRQIGLIDEIFHILSRNVLWLYENDQKLKELQRKTGWLRTLNTLLPESLLTIQGVDSQLKMLPRLKIENDYKMIRSYKYVSIWKEVFVAYVKLIFAY